MKAMYMIEEEKKARERKVLNRKQRNGKEFTSNKNLIFFQRLNYLSNMYNPKSNVKWEICTPS